MESKAKWVAEMMKEDGITAEHVNKMTEAEKIEMAMAYMAAIGRKIQQIQDKYRSSTDAKMAMQKQVLSIM